MAVRDTDRSLAARVHSVAIRVLRWVRPADAEAGMSAARLSALSVLVFGGPRSLMELADAEQVTSPTMSRLIGALEKDGLVTREREASDARRLRLAATAAGRAALEAGRARRVERLEGLLAGLTVEERTVVAEATAILESLLGRG